LASTLNRVRDFFLGRRARKRFQDLDWEWRNIVVYSESGQDWHHFSGLIGELTGPLDRRICYVSSDPKDPGLDFEHDNFMALYIPDGLSLTLFFQFKRCDLCVLTVMDLDNLNLRRSINPVHYLYVFHSMGSTHMVDHANSYDAYDTLFCAGPHQVAEIRRREELHGLPAKILFDFGHPRLEAVVAERQKRGAIQVSPEPPTILIAPTWGDTSIFNTCGEALIEVLLRAGFRVIMRPHYQSLKQSPEVIAALRKRFEGEAGFEYVDRMSETDSILRSNLLVSDWSAMALEYAWGLEKPVLFIDVPRRIRNPHWKELGIEPMESSIRSRVGRVLSPDDLARAPELVRQLLEDPAGFSDSVRGLREEVVFRLGHSIPDGARKIARIADELAHKRAQGDDR
jgi:hypothetical protein